MKKNTKLTILSILAIILCFSIVACNVSVLDPSETNDSQEADEYGNDTSDTLDEDTNQDTDSTDGTDGTDESDTKETEANKGTSSNTAEESEMVSITKYAQPSTGKDVTEQIQKAINENPNKTIYFPDGSYLISSPILTPALATMSVSLKLSNYAVIKASRDWKNVDKDGDGISEAMIRLGGKTPSSSNTLNGTNYFLEGGMIDGNGVANGVSIDSGRNTRISNVSIRNTFIGLYIKYGSNGGSSDADINGVNIVGNKKKGSIGAVIKGFDNTLTNMRIEGVQIGVQVLSGGNFLDNIHPLYSRGDELVELFDQTIGFDEQGGGNFFDNCYADSFQTCFKINGWASQFSNCFGYWYADFGNVIAFDCTGSFNSIIESPRMSMNYGTNHIFFRTAESGTGIINNPMFHTGVWNSSQNNYRNYITGKIITI